MMSLKELIELRSRLIAARANRQEFGAAEAYATMLEGEVTLTDFNSRRATVRHLLALVEAAIEARTSSTKPLRGRLAVTEIIDEAAFDRETTAPTAPVVEEPATKEPKGKSRRSRSARTMSSS